MSFSQYANHMLGISLHKRAPDVVNSSQSLNPATESAIIIGAVMFVLAVPGTVAAVLAIKRYRSSKNPRSPADIEVSAAIPPSAPLDAISITAVHENSSPTNSVHTQPNISFTTLEGEQKLDLLSSQTSSTTPDGLPLYSESAGTTVGENIEEDGES